MYNYICVYDVNDGKSFINECPVEESDGCILYDVLENPAFINRECIVFYGKFEEKKSKFDLGKHFNCKIDNYILENLPIEDKQ